MNSDLKEYAESVVDDAIRGKTNDRDGVVDEIVRETGLPKDVVNWMIL